MFNSSEDKERADALDERDAEKTAVIEEPGGGSEPVIGQETEAAEESAAGKAAKVAVRPAADAKRRIVDRLDRELGKGPEGIDGDEAREIVSPIVDALYDAYEQNGTVPTREAFAARCDREDVGGIVLGMKDPFLKSRIARKVAVGAAAIVVVAGLGIGIWAYSAAQPQEAEPVATPQQKQTEEPDEEVGTGIVRFGIDAPNWSEESSPFIALVTGETDEGEAVDFYHAVWADGSTDTVELASGTYQVAWTSAINPDGSIYRTPDQPAEIVVQDDAAANAAENDPTGESSDNGGSVDQDQDATDSGSDGKAEADESENGGSSDADADPSAPGDEGSTDVDAPVIDADESFEQVPAEDVTQDDLDHILDDIEQAVGSGDETLSGDAGQTVVDTATGNASNNPNADQGKIDQAQEDASGNVSQEAQKPAGGTSGSGSSAGGSATGSTGGSSGTSGSGSSASSGSGSSSTGGGTSGSGSGSSSGSSGGSQAHTHNWVAQTSQQWVQDSAAWSEQVWVQDSAAWSEQVQTGSHIQCSCGQTFSSNAEWSAHSKDMLINQGQSHSYSVVPTYETVYHEATGHYETVNHPATGHYETVTTGYKCSTCGATK